MKTESEKEKPENIDNEKLNLITKNVRETFESTNFSRISESIDSLINSETENLKIIQLKDIKTKIQQYHWKLKKGQGKKETAFRNIAKKIIEIESITNQ